MDYMYFVYFERLHYVTLINSTRDWKTFKINREEYVITITKPVQKISMLVAKAGNESVGEVQMHTLTSAFTAHIHFARNLLKVKTKNNM